MTLLGHNLSILPFSSNQKTQNYKKKIGKIKHIPYSSIRLFTSPPKWTPSALMEHEHQKVDFICKAFVIHEISLSFFWSTKIEHLPNWFLGLKFFLKTFLAFIGRTKGRKYIFFKNWKKWRKGRKKNLLVFCTQLD